MLLDLFLLRYGKIGTILSITASILLIYAANESIDLDIASIENKPAPDFNPTPAQIVLFALVVAVIANTISLDISLKRYRQQYLDKLSGKDINLVPNINFIIGTSLSLIGGLFSTLAAKQKVDQGAQVIIPR